jgi:hypothetical protein
LPFSRREGSSQTTPSWCPPGRLASSSSRQQASCRGGQQDYKPGPLAA